MSDSKETPAESSAPVAEAGWPIDSGSALHPFERSRLILALSGGFVVLTGAIAFFVATVGWFGLLVAGFVLLVIVGLIWLLLQVGRARLLGNAIRVEPDSLPDVYAALVTVRKQLDYYRHVDLYVVAELNGKATWLSFLGHRVIILEGDFVAKLISAESQAGLRFVIGSFLGALKARHARVLPLLLLLQFLDAVKFAALLILPYYRATRYSGDQFGYLCSGDLKASIGAVSRLLVGNETAPVLGVRGVIDQIESVQTQPFPRLAQMISDAPHLVNRYLNILAFSAQVTPQEFQAFTEDLSEDVRQRLSRLLANTPHTEKRSENWPQSGPVRPTYVGVILVATSVFVLGLVWLDPNKAEPPDQISPTPVESISTTPTSVYTARELFGAEPRNGTCNTSVPENTLTGYEIEEVGCNDQQYFRYFYKYSETDPDGWIAAARASGVFDNIRFYDGGSCFDTYTATYTIEGGTRYNTALFVFHDTPFVAGVSANAILANVTTVVNAGFYVTENAALC